MTPFNPKRIPISPLTPPLVRDGFPEREVSWIRDHHLIIVALLSLLLVAVIGLSTGTTPPTHDSFYYLNIAEAGLLDNPGLAAPYAYRFGTPLIVRCIHQVSFLSVPEAFQVVTFLCAWGILVASYVLARYAGGNMSTGFAVIGVIGFSFFNVKFPLAVPTMVDTQGLLLITLALWALLRKRFGLCLFISCAGMFFKEFLLVPGALIIFEKLKTYRQTGTTAPLVWVTLTLCLMLACFIVPRMAIPVVTGYGANFRWDFPTPDHWAYLGNLRYFLSGRPDAGRLINICFALTSYWLPVLLLATPDRVMKAWRSLSTLRSLCLLHVAIVVSLTLFGGTNIMIFVAYSLPALVIVLVFVVGAGVHTAEIVIMLLAVLLYNRIPFPTGGPTSTIDDIVQFYGGWWSRVDTVTLFRTLEMCGYLILLSLFRLVTGRQRRKGEDNS